MICEPTTHDEYYMFLAKAEEPPPPHHFLDKFCEIVENYRPNLEVMPGGLARLAGNMIAVISLSRSRRRPTPNHCHYQYDQLRPPKTIWPLFRPGKMTKIISSRGTQYFHCRGGEQSSEKFFLQLAQMASTSCGGGCHMY